MTRRPFWILGIASIAVTLAITTSTWGIERFPPPDFTEHALPATQFPSPDSPWIETASWILLVACLGLAAWFGLVKRSRRGLLGLAVFSLIWFGFIRGGCICSIGATQNVVFALSDSAYSIPYVAILFFALPLLAALFFGRVFCASVCPLGVVQEIVLLKPLRVPEWLENALGLVRYVYLGAAVLFAIDGVAFLICRYDPFVGIFRLNASVEMAVFGGTILLLAVFVGRPYCRFLCPYGALLGLCSSVARSHVRIAPEECVSCRLCEDACPYGAIRRPTKDNPEPPSKSRRRLALVLMVLPFLIAAGCFLGRGLAVPLSNVHPNVRLAERVAAEEAGAFKETNDASAAFRNTGRPIAELMESAGALEEDYAFYGCILGGWVGLVIGGKLVQLCLRRRRDEYSPDMAKCVSCGRCFEYCPTGPEALYWIERLESQKKSDQPA